MTSIFGHGRLRLYLLKLLDEEPRHGYDVIRLLKDRFMGVYAPSAGTIYPRLTRLEEEGLVEHETVDGKKVYHLTDAGRQELADRGDELAALEQDIARSVHDLAQEVREDVRSSVRSLREELKAAAREARDDERSSRRSDSGPGHGPWSPGWDPFDGDVPGRDEAREAMRQAKEALKDAARQAKEQARQAKGQAKRQGKGGGWAGAWSGSWGSDWQGAWEANWDKAKAAQDDVRGQLVVLAEQLRREVRLAVRAGIDDEEIARIRASLDAAIETVRGLRDRS